MHLWFPKVLMLYQELDSFVLPLRKRILKSRLLMWRLEPQALKNQFKSSEWRQGANGDLKAHKCYSIILLWIKSFFHLKYISKIKAKKEQEEKHEANQKKIPEPWLYLIQVQEDSLMTLKVTDLISPQRKPKSLFLEFTSKRKPNW